MRHFSYGLRRGLHSCAASRLWEVTSVHFLRRARVRGTDSDARPCASIN